MSKALIEAFIEDENTAERLQVQGKFYPSNHHRLRPLEKKVMNDIDDTIKVDFYYHLLRLSFHRANQNLIPENNFPLLKKAYCNLLSNYKEGGIYETSQYHSSLRINGSGMFKIDASFIFGAMEYSLQNLQIVDSLSYNDYCLFDKVIKQCTTYTSYPNMRKKWKRFEVFSVDNLVLNRITKTLDLIEYKAEDFPSSPTFWAFLMLFIMIDNSESKTVIQKIIDKNTDRSSVWILGSFFKDFKDKEVANQYLETLYKQYPKEYIDEYYIK